MASITSAIIIYTVVIICTMQIFYVYFLLVQTDQKSLQDW